MLEVLPNCILLPWFPLPSPFEMPMEIRLGTTLKLNPWHPLLMLEFLIAMNMNTPKSNKNHLFHRESNNLDVAGTALKIRTESTIHLESQRSLFSRKRTIFVCMYVFVQNYTYIYIYKVYLFIYSYIYLFIYIFIYLSLLIYILIDIFSSSFPGISPGDPNCHGRACGSL